MDDKYVEELENDLFEMEDRYESVKQKHEELEVELDSKMQYMESLDGQLVEYRNKVKCVCVCVWSSSSLLFAAFLDMQSREAVRASGTRSSLLSRAAAAPWKRTKHDVHWLEYNGRRSSRRAIDSLERREWGASQSVRSSGGSMPRSHGRKWCFERRARRLKAWNWWDAWQLSGWTRRMPKNRCWMSQSCMLKF